MKPRIQSNAGNPIRRPPGSGESSGYASSSGYSGGYSSSSSSFDDRTDSSMSSSIAAREQRRTTRTSVADGILRSSSSTTPASDAAAFDATERARVARVLLLLACLWPLLFLLIPPSSTDRSRVALLAAADGNVAAMSALEHSSSSSSLSERVRRAERRAGDGIDVLRERVSRKVIGNLERDAEFLRKEMRSLVRRTDVVGYGPERPRVAVCVVVPAVVAGGENENDESYNEEESVMNGALKAVESIFRTTDRNRIFVVTVVVDGRGKVGSFEAGLEDVDAGRTAHRHGDQVHTHDHHKGWKNNDEKSEGGGAKEEETQEAHAHSEKIHAIYNHESIGTSASRREAVQFVNVLTRDHEAAGLKSPEEDLILLFLRCDARLMEGDNDQRGGGGGGRTWLDDVTDALILTPDSEEGGALPPASAASQNGKKVSAPRQQPRPANAVSFNVYYSSADSEGNTELHPPRAGDVLAFDRSLRPLPSRATAAQMSLSDGESYPAPLTTVATALRLKTYSAFPASDDRLANTYAADLELSFNLWMCADGIDVLGGSSLARVVVDPRALGRRDKAELSGPSAARIVGAWIDGPEDEEAAGGILRAVAEGAAAAMPHSKHKSDDGGNSQKMMDHTLSERRELSERTREIENALVRIASEAKQSASFPTGLAKKCRPFSWYAHHVHPNEMMFREEGGAASDPYAKMERRRNAPNDESDVRESLVPSKPLDEARMAIVAKASPVKLPYVDASGGHVAHPHKGATFENGVTLGYVHDETALRRNPPPFEIANGGERDRLCRKGDPNWKMLTEKVYVDLTNHEAAERRAEHGLARRGRAKIFCVVYTIEKFHDRIPLIRETWGQKCDGFMVASTKTDEKLGTVNIPHEGPEEYNNIWQKVRAIWSYIYDNYYENYDYFHIGGDDLYLIVENLRLYLESEEIRLASNGGQTLPNGSEDSQTPLFLGRRFAEGGNRDHMFISGGSGYTMNKAALKLLVVEGFPTCFPHMHTFSEDVMVATCFRKMDVLPYDTKDEAGGERYMPFQPGHHLTYTPPANPKDDWYSNYSVDVKWGIDHCAAKSVAFHYIKGDLMKRIHAILYHHC